MAAIGKVSAVFTASTGGLTAGVKAASSSFRSLQNDTRSLENAIRGLSAIAGAQLFGSIASAATRAAAAFVNLGKSAASAIAAAVGEATSLGEETSKSAVIFGNSASEIAKFADGAAAIGLSRQAALQATGSFGNLFTAMGLGSAQAASYATTLTSLGADLASFNNSTVDEAVQALGAALRGEAEPIRRFGVLLDEATLKQAALSAGLIASTSASLTPAIKAQAAYAAILKQTTKAQGDFARTGSSLANLSRVIQAQTSNIFSSLGSAFEPLFQSIASATTQVLSAVGPLFSQVVEGVKAAVSQIAAAIQLLVPAFVQFVGTVDGQSVGQAIGDGILRGALFLAGAGDALIANFGSVFSFFSEIGKFWSARLDYGARVASLFYGAFKVFEVVGNVIGGLFSDIVAGLYYAAAGIAGVLPGFKGLAAELQTSADSWNAQARQFGKTMIENDKAAGAAFAKAFSAGAGDVGPTLAGPLTAALSSAAASAESSAKALSAASPEALATDQKLKVDIDQNALKPISVEQTVSVNVDEALKGIDSRSQDGVAEMYRIMRGGAGDIQQRQLNALETIAENTAGGDESSPFPLD